MIDITRRRRLKIVNSEIDFKAVVSESVNNLRNLENAHKVEVEISVEEYFPFFSDLRQVSILFNNIISNAIKYQHIHEQSPKLNINIVVDATKVVIVFKDNGVGIVKEDLSKVFDMFYRSKGVKVEGSGLGLYIVKEIVKKLKGRIFVDSEIGAGSQFVIELPNKIDPDY